MTKYLSSIIVVVSFAAFGLVISCQQQSEKPTSQNVSLLFADITCMHQIQKEDTLIQKALAELRVEAERALSQGPFSVVYKTRIPPSGDKHDYMSQGPYWWPDPEKPDGLPYIRKDGEENPGRRTFKDKQYLSQLIDLTDILGKAYFFWGNEAYAKKAAELIRTWFITEDTKMNPNLNYGQAIPGRSEGRGIGIIETRELGLILDAVALIRSTEHWAESDEAGIQSWCIAYLEWLLTSKHGLDESVHPNNHGTWYDVQTSALALFTGQDSIAERLCLLAKERRLDAHITSDGSQPRELARTRSWDYSCMNLWGLFQLARVANQVGVDLWTYPQPEVSKLQSALDYLLPYALGEQDWPHEQIRTFQPEKLIPHLEMAVTVFPDRKYREALEILQNRYPKAAGIECF